MQTQPTTITTNRRREYRHDTPERWAAALARAVSEGVTVRQLAGSGAWIATSGTDADVAYVVSITACECRAACEGDPVCKHRGALRHKLGILSPEPPPVCPACGGRGGQWLDCYPQWAQWEACRACTGRRAA